MSILTLFEEDDLVMKSPTMMPASAAPSLTDYSFPILGRATYVSASQRKRTRFEALTRLYAIKSPDLSTYPTWVQRRARVPLMLYDAAWWGAVGLVVVDPLDRLDGVV